MVGPQPKPQEEDEDEKREERLEDLVDVDVMLEELVRASLIEELEVVLDEEEEEEEEVDFVEPRKSESALFSESG